jgi:hypothetical protein
MFFKRQQSLKPVFGKIEVFARHCYFSKISSHKERPPGFSQEKCFRNLLATIDRSKANLTCFLDAPQYVPHFVDTHDDPVIRFEMGSEASSFLYLLDHIASLSLHPDTLIYIVEDDYLHRAGWTGLLLEGFSIQEADYVTLYDHSDKYFDPTYRKLTSKLFATKSSHWRTTPSTTNTFATRFQTLLDDLKIQRRYSLKRTISADHQKFIALQKNGRTLLSSVPGFSTHAEPKFASPCTNWNPYLEEPCN